MAYCSAELSFQPTKGTPTFEDQGAVLVVESQVTLHGFVALPGGLLVPLAREDIKRFHASFSAKKAQARTRFTRVGPGLPSTTSIQARQQP